MPGHRFADKIWHNDKKLLDFSITNEEQWPPSNCRDFITNYYECFLGIINFCGETIGRTLMYGGLGMIVLYEPFYNFRLTNPPYTVCFDVLLTVFINF